MFLDKDGRNGWHHVFFWAAVFAAVVLSVFVLGSAAVADTEGGASNAAILDLSVKITLPDGYPGIVIDENELFTGTHNTFYSHALDMPLTRFVLGNVTLDHSKLKGAMEKAMNDRKQKAIGGGGGGPNQGIGDLSSAFIVKFDWESIGKVNANASGVCFRCTQISKIPSKPLKLAILVLAWVLKI